MFLTRKHLSRRTLRKGAGASNALPLLDAMIPAGTALAQTAAVAPPRLGFVYFPHGALQDEWQPKKIGRDFDFPFILKPLEPFRDHLTVISGLRNKGGEGGTPHGYTEETWLSCVLPRSRNVASGRGVCGMPHWALHEYSSRGYVKGKRLGEKGLFATLYAAIRTDMLDAPYMRDFLLTAKDTSFSTLDGVSAVR